MPRRKRFTHIKKHTQLQPALPVQPEPGISSSSAVQPAQPAVSPAPEASASLEELLEVCKFPNSSWSNQTSSDRPLQSIKLCKLSTVPSASTQPLTVVCCLTIQQDLTWVVHVYGHEIHRADTCLSMPSHLDIPSLPLLLDVLDKLSLCPGNPDPHFLEMADGRKGKFNSAVIDNTVPVKIGDKTYSRTLRTNSCQLLVGMSGGRCTSCKSYRSQLRATYSRWSKKSPTRKKFGNNRYLDTPQRQEKLKSLQSRATNAEKELKKLKERIANSAEKIGTSVDSYLHADLKQIISENQASIHNQFPEGSFKRLFWDQQAKAASLSDARQMRWHPVMVRWCLNLKLLSSGAYHALRSSGFVQLPSEMIIARFQRILGSSGGSERVCFNGAVYAD